MYRLFGRTPEQFSGIPDEVLSFVHPEDRAEFRHGYTAAVQDDTDFFEQEFRIVRPNGEVRWVHRRGRVRRGPDGQARSVLGVALDITERKQAEEANARLASLVSGADDAIMGMALDGTILSWNPAAERLFGYPADDDGRPIGAHVSIPRAPTPSSRRCTPACAPASTFATKACDCGATARPSHVSVVVTPVLGKNGVAVGASAIVRDITERKRTEQQLVDTLALLMQTSNQRKMALAAGGMGTFEVDIEHDRITWSDEIYAAGRRRAHGRARCRPRTSSASSIPTICQRTRARRAEAFASGGVYENEFRIIRPGRRGALDLRARAGLAERRQAGAGARREHGHHRAQGARGAHPLPDVGGVAPLEEPAGGGAGDRLADRQGHALARRLRRRLRRAAEEPRLLARSAGAAGMARRLRARGSCNRSSGTTPSRRRARQRRRART